MHRKSTLVTLIALFSLASVSAFGQEVKGMIKNRIGDTLVVATAQGGDVTVVLTNDTVTKDNTGLFGLGKEKMAATVLIPGLKVDVDGTAGENGQVVAKKITVDGDDLETSEMIEAGLHPTAQQVEANVQKLEEHEAQIDTLRRNSPRSRRMAPPRKKDCLDATSSEADTERFMALGDYDVKGQATMHFSSGSSTISAADQAELKKLAETTNGLKGYLIEVTGYADSTGDAVMNTTLSENRAKAVITYLFQQCSVPMRHIVAPGAMGEYGATAPNETKAGRAENRRADVKVLVSKGSAGS